MVILYITLWLLSGFLAAWVGFKVADQERYNSSYREVFWTSICGLFSLTLIIVYILFHSDIMSKPLFKAKEKK